MKTCENCSSLNDGNYGSGRFCSSKCARGFSTKSKRVEINEKVRLTLTKIEKKLIEKKCKHCDTLFLTFNKKRNFCNKSCSGKHNAKGWNNHNIVNWSFIHKKAYADGRNYVAGGTTKWIEVETSNGKIKVQGSYEVKTCKILDKWKHDKTIYNWEYTSDKIEYIGLDNKTHSYLIDFKVFNFDGSFWYLEVKGLIRDNDELKWKAVRDKGLKLKVWFKKDIEKYGKFV